MSYGIEKTDRLPAELVRIVREQIDKAVSDTSAASDLRERVHLIRTCLKKTRSLLRLLEPSVPPAFYDAEDRRYRDLGRRLAPIRDAFVELTSFDAVGLPADNPAARRARELLARNDKIQLSHAKSELEAIRPLLTDAQAGVDKWPIDHFQARHLCVGMRRVYRTARKAYAKARKKPDAKTLHNWRGKTKSFWHALRLCEAFLPKTFQKQCKCADALASLLGDYHDLTVLIDTLDRLPKAIKGRKPLNRKLAKRAGALQKRAFARGRVVFDPKPAAWTKKLADRLSLK